MKKILIAGAAGAALAVALSLGAQVVTPAPVLPTGTIIAYAGSGTPYGFTDCNAAGTVTRASALGRVLAGAWGPGDGSTTYDKPALARRTLVGAGGATAGGLANALGNVGGAETVTLTTANLPASGLSIPSLSVSASGSSAITTYSGGENGVFNVVAPAQTDGTPVGTAGGSASVTGSTGGGTTGNMGTGGATNIRDPAAVVRFLCKL